METNTESAQVLMNPLHVTTAEMEVPLCDQSLKRQMEDGDEETRKNKKAMKKRRSSLSSVRRSIVMGDLPEPPSESGSSATGSQESGGSSDQVTCSQGSQGAKLKPNPANLKMDAIIELMHSQIKKLNKESAEWQAILDAHTQKEEESKLMCSNLEIQESQVPEDVKQLAQSTYIKVKPLDLKAVKDQVVDILENYKFDREDVCKNLHLIQTFAEALQSNNKMLASHLEQAMVYNDRDAEEEDSKNSTYHGQEKKMDSKDAISKFISSQ